MKETGRLLWRGRGIGSESLRGRVAVVTGASSGIGAAVARALASEGAHLALVARREDALLQVQDGLGGAGDEARSLIVPADVTDPQQVKSLLARAEEELGPVDVLVNCAGVMYYTLVLFPKYTTPWAKVPRPARRRCVRGALRADISRLKFLKLEDVRPALPLL